MAAFQNGHGYVTLWEAHLETRLRESIRNGSSRPGRKLRYFLPCPLLGDADVIGVLQVEPELRACAEPVPETKSGVAGDTPATMDDLRHAIRRDANLTRKLGRRNAKFGQLVGENFSGVDRGSRHNSNSFQW
jgi:hypothetical protein